jgi:hypothetical protein
MTEVGGAARVAKNQGSCVGGEQRRGAGQMAVAVEHEVAASTQPIDQRTAEWQLLAGRPAEASQDAFAGVVVRQGQRVVMHHQDDHRTGRRSIEGSADLGEVVLAHRAVSRDERSIVQARGVEAYQGQARLL